VLYCPQVASAAERRGSAVLYFPPRHPVPEPGEGVGVDQRPGIWACPGLIGIDMVAKQSSPENTASSSNKTIHNMIRTPHQAQGDWDGRRLMIDTCMKPPPTNVR
jgi:hypothetical protein